MNRQDLAGKIKRRSTALHLLLKKKALRMLSPYPQTKTLFVVGSQRSGTTMLLHQLNKHKHVDVYHDYSKAMQYLRIKDLNYIAAIVEKSKAKVVVFKPLEDSHRTIEFLDYFNGSRAIWIFRHFSDVVNSSISEGWGEHHRRYIKRIHDQEHFAYIDALNVTKRNLKLIRELYDPATTPETCVALVWYLRNTIFFDYKMQENKNVRLLQYELLVSDPLRHMTSILKSVGLPYAKPVVKGIHAKSVRKQPSAIIENDVSQLCEDMYSKLVHVLGNNSEDTHASWSYEH